MPPAAIQPVMPPTQRLLVMIAVMAATIMVVLDATIANVALPHMQASLGASQESVNWVLTSYILATAIAMPVTGWLSDRFGRRTLFTVAVAGFTISSALCGVAASLPMMVAARFLQGVFGAFIAPLSQAVMYDINPPEKHASAMTIWGMGVMVGPVVGPMLGGWLTDQLDWRWVFFVNVPVGIVTTVAVAALLPAGARLARRFDVAGFALLAISLGAFQLMLDRGTQQDWFAATEIWVEAAVTAGAFWMFVVHTMTTKAPLLPVALMRDRTFVVAMALVMLLGAVMMAGGTLVAPMLQRLFGYPVFDAGLMVAPRGLGTMAGMLVAGRLTGRIDVRLIVFAGLAGIAGSLWMQTGFDLEMDGRLVIWSGAIQGAGLGMVMMPLNLTAFSTLAPRLRTDAASLYSLMRNIGGSIAISVASALMAINAQTSHMSLGAHVTATQLPFIDAGLVGRFGIPAEAVLGMVDLEVNRQALMISYLDDFWMMMWAALVMLPLAFLLRPARRPPGPAAMTE